MDYSADFELHQRRHDRVGDVSKRIGRRFRLWIGLQADLAFWVRFFGFRLFLFFPAASSSLFERFFMDFGHNSALCYLICGN